MPNWTFACHQKINVFCLLAVSDFIFWNRNFSARNGVWGWDCFVPVSFGGEGRHSLGANYHIVVAHVETKKNQLLKPQFFCSNLGFGALGLMWPVWAPLCVVFLFWEVLGGFISVVVDLVYCGCCWFCCWFVLLWLLLILLLLLLLSCCYWFVVVDDDRLLMMTVCCCFWSSHYYFVVVIAVVLFCFVFVLFLF